MAKKNKIKFPIFVITLVIGLGLIGFALFEADFDIGTVTNFQLTGLSFIDVPIDPVTGGILGTIVLGAPDEKPFEQAGTVIGKPFSLSRNASPRSPCTDNFLALDGIGTTKDSSSASTDPNDFGRVILMPPDFERRLSGERNQLDPVWWGSKLTDSTTFPIFSGVASYTCAFAYAQWDIVDIPNDFVVENAVLKLKVLEIRKATNLTFQLASQQCTITLQDFNLDTIADEGIMNKVWRVGGVSTPLTIVSGTWCNTLGVKTFQLSQSAVDLINDAISGGAFSQGVRSDKLLLGFMPTLLNNEAQQFNKNRISTEYWKTEGSLFLTGSSPPIKCDIGFSQVGFRCVPIVCAVTFELNQVTNECEPIQCEANETLQVISEPVFCTAVCIDDPSTPEFECGSACPDSISRAVCVPIVPIPPMTSCESPLILIGETCQDPSFQCDVILNCQEGTRPNLNNCGCELIECQIGQELNNDQCQNIVCPINTVISGNDCIEKQCPVGQISSNNECVPETIKILCVEGFKQVGDQCVAIVLDCPEGSEQFENVCVQRVPDLLMVSGINPSLFLILGLVITGMSGVGIVARRRG